MIYPQDYQAPCLAWYNSRKVLVTCADLKIGALYQPKPAAPLPRVEAETQAMVTHRQIPIEYDQLRVNTICGGGPL